MTNRTATSALWRAVLAIAFAMVATGCAAPSSPDATTPSTPETTRSTPEPTPAPPTSPRPAVPDGPVTLTVMSYNVLGGVPPNDWFPLIDPAELDPMAREPGIVAKIRHVNPDIAGLQEFRPELPSGQQMMRDLADYTWLQPDVPSPEPVAIPLLWRTSRFDRVDSGFEKITSAADGCSGTLERYASWAKLRDKDTGRTIVAVNAHLCPFQTAQSAAVRSASIDRVVALIDRIDPGLSDPFVLTGDFNTPSTENRPIFRDPSAKLVAAGLVDTKNAAAKDVSDVPRAGSYNGMQASVHGTDRAKAIRRTDRHMDYVWTPKHAQVATWATVSGPGVAWRTIAGTKVPVWTGVIPSDHSPVVAKVTFPRA